MQQKQKKNERREVACDAVCLSEWTLALLGAMIGTNEPSIAPTTSAEPANA